MSHRMIIVDMEPLYRKQQHPRFVLCTDIDPMNSTTGHGAWRQLKPYSKMWQSGGGFWEFLPDGRVIFKYSTQHRNVSGVPCALYDAKGSPLSDFPMLNQYGMGHFYDTPNLDKSQKKSRFLWFIDNVEWQPPDPAYLWLGLGAKFGGHAAIHRREAAYGFMANVADPSKIWEIGFTSSGWGPGLGSSTGIFLIVVTAKDAKEVVGATSSQWDFNFAFAGKIDGYIKASRAAFGAPAASQLGKIAQSIMQNAHLGRAGDRLHQALPSLNSGLMENFMNAGKIVCCGLAVDWKSPGFSLLDLPVSTPGLELGLLSVTTKVEDTYPLFA